MSKSQIPSVILTEMSDSNYQFLYMSNDEKNKTISELQQRVRHLLDENKKLITKNNQLEGKISFFQDFLINLNAQISQDQNKINLLEAIRLRCSLDQKKIEMIMKMEQFEKKIQLIKKNAQKDKQTYLEVMQAKKIAMTKELQSYDHLIQEKTKKIEQSQKFFKSLQAILGINKGQIDQEMILSKIVEIRKENSEFKEVLQTENRRFKETLSQKEKQVVQLIQAVTQARKRAYQ